MVKCFIYWKVQIWVNLIFLWTQIYFDSLANIHPEEKKN